MPIQKDARVPGFESWWDVPVAAVSGEAGVRQAHEDWERAREKQRFYYGA